MSGEIKDWVSLHAHRLGVGMNNWVILSGGFLAALGLALGTDWGTLTKAALTCLLLFFFGGIAVVYECGRRILNAEARAKSEHDISDLGYSLAFLEARIAELERSPAQLFLTGANLFIPPETEREIQRIETTLLLRYGAAESALFTSTTGCKYTSVPLNHPFLTVEAERQKSLDLLRHKAAQLKTIITRRLSR
jgi:hypothetical protein